MSKKQNTNQYHWQSLRAAYQENNTSHRRRSLIFRWQSQLPLSYWQQLKVKKNYTRYHCQSLQASCQRRITPFHWQSLRAAVGPRHKTSLSLTITANTSWAYGQKTENPASEATSLLPTTRLLVRRSCHDMTCRMSTPLKKRRLLDARRCPKPPYVRRDLLSSPPARVVTQLVIRLGCRLRMYEYDGLYQWDVAPNTCYYCLSARPTRTLNNKRQWLEHERNGWNEWAVLLNSQTTQYHKGASTLKRNNMVASDVFSFNKIN